MRSTIYEIFNGLKKNVNSVFILDGGTGEELFAHGVPDDRKIWSATAIVNEQYHETLKQVHRSFLEAGANAITTNTYGIVPGVGFTMEEINRYCEIAGRLGRAAVEEHVAMNSNRQQNKHEKVNNGCPCIVFGSMGPLIESYRADKIMERNDGVNVYHTMAVALAQYVDAFLAETLSSIEEALQVCEAVAKLNATNGLDIPLLISFTVNSVGELRSGEAATIAISQILRSPTLASNDPHVRVLAFLFNCSEPESISHALRQVNDDDITMKLLEAREAVLGAYANRLTPVAPDWTLEASHGPQQSRSDLDPKHYHADFVQKWVCDWNVKIVGGCCAMTPEHISYLSSKYKLR